MRVLILSAFHISGLGNLCLRHLIYGDFVLAYGLTDDKHDIIFGHTASENPVDLDFLAD